MSDWKKEAFEGQENYDGSEDFGFIALERLKKQAAAGNKAAQKALKEDGGDWVKEAFAGESGYVEQVKVKKPKVKRYYVKQNWKKSVFEPQD